MKKPHAQQRPPVPPPKPTAEEGGGRRCAYPRCNQLHTRPGRYCSAKCRRAVTKGDVWQVPKNASTWELMGAIQEQFPQWRAGDVLQIGLWLLEKMVSVPKVQAQLKQAFPSGFVGKYQRGKDEED